MFVGQKHWDALPPDYKAAFNAGCAEGNTWMMAKYDAQNPAALRRLVAGGTQLRPFPKAVMDACYKAAMQRYDEENAKNPKWKKIYDSYLAFQREQVLWFRVCENTYDNYMAVAGQQPQASGGKKS
jgi:TRAP-type mannitol/chloroaromatic compound transport system substrate-binding protein